MKNPTLKLVAASLCAIGLNMAAAQTVELKTNQGLIVMEMDAKAAPKHVENFLEYVKSGHYDGTIFHRVMKDFMAQGGGFTKDMVQKPTRPSVAHEGPANAAVGAKNVRGAVAAARTPDPNSASSQFFINYKHNAFLDFRSPDMQGYGYTVFAKVTSGMEIVDKWADAPQGGKGGHQNVPNEAIIIEKATIKK